MVASMTPRNKRMSWIMIAIYCVLTAWMACLVEKMHAADGSAPQRLRILYASTATSFSPIWGVTFITKPTGTTFWVVV